MILNHFDMIILWVEMFILLLNVLGIPPMILYLINPEASTKFFWFFCLIIYFNLFAVSLYLSWGYILFFGFLCYQIITLFLVYFNIIKI